MDAKQLREEADNLFSKRTTLNLLWQEIALHFYPERADFAYQRYIGQDMAAHLMTSYPVLCRRDLGNQLGTMLRPTETPWFHLSTIDPRKETVPAKRYLEWAESVMRRAMYDRTSLFTRATKEGDHDFAAFGQCVITVEIYHGGASPHLLYRCWHLRDVVWHENTEGKICPIFRKWKPTARNLVTLFGGETLHSDIRKKAEKHPFTEVNCMHMIVDADMYEGDARGKPYWSIYYDCDHDCVIEATPVKNKMYVIPRWQTVSGSQYAFSPATVAALPDGRLLQAMTRTILEAGEKAVYPPMIATENAVRSEVNLFAGGITWVEQDYDEKLGASLRPIEQDLKGMPIGRELLMDSRELMRSVFYLDKLSMPMRKPQMTAFEVGQLVQQYVRDALPIFEPMEQDYDAALCEETFTVLQHAGAFGGPDLIPDELKGAETQWRFQSPLHDAIEETKAQKLVEAKTLIATYADIDPSVKYLINAPTALRDAMKGKRVPAVWIRTDEEASALSQQEQTVLAAGNALKAMETGSNVAANLAGAQRDLAQAQPAPA